MTMLAQLDSDIKDAMRAKAMDRLTVLRGLKSAIKAMAIEKGLADEAMDAPMCLAIIRKELKKRQDSIAAFEATRPDLADKEKAEIEVLSAYLPQQLSDAEIQKEIDDLQAILNEIYDQAGFDLTIEP